MDQRNLNYSKAAIFIWLGFVLAISFMEAWLKFRAPGITIPLGLGIGRLVFAGLNKVEWFFALTTLLQFIIYKWFPKISLLYVLIWVILLVQTFYMLPFLDQRAEVILNGGEVPHSRMHFIYIVVEAVKVVCLAIFGRALLVRK